MTNHTGRRKHLPSMIGFEDIFKLLEIPTESQKTQKTDFPPHNLVKIDDNKYQLTLAIVGRNQEDIDISVTENVLTVSSDAIDPIEGSEVLYNGIAFRAFKKEFTLHEHVVIKSAILKNGLLTIDMKYVIPEEKLPKTINIQ